MAADTLEMNTFDSQLFAPNIHTLNLPNSKRQYY